MEILFHRYGSICEPDIIEAFKSLGIAVDEENSEISEKNISGDVRIKLLAERILTKKPAFVFSINYFPYISEVCQRLKMLCLNRRLEQTDVCRNGRKSTKKRIKDIVIFHICMHFILQSRLHMREHLN